MVVSKNEPHAITSQQPGSTQEWTSPAPESSSIFFLLKWCLAWLLWWRATKHARERENGEPQSCALSQQEFITTHSSGATMWHTQYELQSIRGAHTHTQDKVQSMGARTHR
eukprot:1155635-Pelagomonas_calceolata.AAC.8